MPILSRVIKKIHKIELYTEYYTLFQINISHLILDILFFKYEFKFSFSDLNKVS